MQSPINSIKHFVYQSRANVATGTILGNTIIDAVAAPASGTSAEVIQGAVIKAVYVELWVVGTDVAGTTGIFTLAVEKLPTSVAKMTHAQAVNLGSYENKKNILYTSQGIVGNDFSSSPTPIIRSWVKIPKGKQRFGLGDRIIINIASTAVMDVCGINIYKEYR